MDLEAVVRAFRRELELLQFSGSLPSHLQSFPSSCCGVVSELLGEFLNRTLGLQAEYVCGERSGGTHAWLELSGVVVDITGDQFEGRPPVFCAEKDAWYRSWEESSRELAAHHVEAWFYHDEQAVLREVIKRAGLPDHDVST